LIPLFKLKIRRKIKHFLKESGMSLLWGQILVQIIMFSSLPFISRVFSAVEVGHWGIFQALGLFLWSFSQLKTDQSLMQAENTTEQHNLIKIGLFSHFLISIFALFIAYFTNIFATFSNTQIGYLGFYLIGLGINQMQQSYQLAQKRFKYLMVLRIYTAILTFPMALIMGILKIENGLLLSLLLGVWLPVLGGLFLLRNFISSKSVAKNWENPIILLKKHENNTIWGSLGGLTSGFIGQFWVLAIAHFFQADIVAAYFMASRICNAPISLMNASLGQYNFRHFQDLHFQGKFTTKAITNYWKKWTTIGLLFYGPILFFGATIFSFVLGEKWYFSGQLAAVLAISSFFIFVTSPTSCGFVVIQQQKKDLFLTILAVFLGLLAFASFYCGVSMLQMLLIFSVLRALENIFFNAVLYTSIQKIQ
jgi:O-antigen/teichoic acid export membrane protein